MLVKVSELSGVSLDYAVALAEGATDLWYDTVATWWVKLDGNHRALSSSWAQSYTPSTDWSQGGPIIERELNNLFKWNKINQEEPDIWCAVHHRRSPDGTAVIQEDGPTPLIAAMRCYVTSKLGREVDVPSEFLK